MTKKIICCVGHIGRESKGFLDYGAVTDGGTSEAVMVLGYVTGIAAMCHERGVGFALVGAGSYAEQALRVNGMTGPGDVVLACHVNAGGGNYGAAFYDHRSAPSNGLSLATEIAGALDFLNGKHIKAEPNHWTGNAYACIRRFNATAICLEPLFLDNPDHLKAAPDMDVLGWILGRTVIDWMDSK